MEKMGRATIWLLIALFLSILEEKYDTNRTEDGKAWKKTAAGLGWSIEGFS